MFFCEPCRVKNKWPTSFSLSYGSCELCRKTAECYDIPSRHLPDPPAQPQSLPLFWGCECGWAGCDEEVEGTSQAPVCPQCGEGSFSSIDGKMYLAAQTSPDRIDYFLSSENRVGIRAERDTKWTKMKNDDRPFPLLYGNAITMALRLCLEKGDVIGALGILPGMACKTVRAICEGKAVVEGNDLDGFTIKYLPDSMTATLEADDA